MKYYVSANCHFDSVQEAASDKEEILVSVTDKYQAHTDVYVPGTYTSIFQSRFLTSRSSKSQSKFQSVL